MRQELIYDGQPNLIFTTNAQILSALTSRAAIQNLHIQRLAKRQPVGASKICAFVVKEKAPRLSRGAFTNCFIYEIIPYW